MSHRESIFFRILRRFGHKVFLFYLLSYIFGFREKRTKHISFLAFEINFLEQSHCDNNKTDACDSHPVDINML